MSVVTDGDDPRSSMDAEDLIALREEGRPIVGRTGPGPNGLIVFAVFAVAAVGLFLMLNANRTSHETSSLVTPVSAPTGSVAYATPPLDLAPASATVIEAPPPPPPAPVTVAAPAATPVAAVAVVDPTQWLRAPSVVVDLQSSPNSATLVPTTATGAPAGATAPDTATASPLAAGAITPLLAAVGGASEAALGSGARPSVAGTLAQPATVQASELNNLRSLITQGAIIPGVLETALSSDLPGYARAVVSRDVRGFDGRSVLIPRGSRLIGEYRSALALGQSRVFVIWTRVIRPDGVSVQIASPGTDALGRGGLEGEVNNHFFSRFGGSILLSVLNAGVAAIGRTPATQITIGSPAAAAGAAAAATSSSGATDTIGPTVTIKQGEAINIFVARDLDFSNVKPVQ